MLLMQNLALKALCSPSVQNTPLLLPHPLGSRTVKNSSFTYFEHLVDALFSFVAHVRWLLEVTYFWLQAADACTHVDCN